MFWCTESLLTFIVSEAITAGCGLWHYSAFTFRIRYQGRCLSQAGIVNVSQQQFILMCFLLALPRLFVVFLLRLLFFLVLTVCPLVVGGAGCTFSPVYLFVLYPIVHCLYPTFFLVFPCSTWQPVINPLIITFANIFSTVLFVTVIQTNCHVFSLAMHQKLYFFFQKKLWPTLLCER